MALKVLELFAGIGACSSALKRLGIDYEIVDAVEIDKYAIKSFNAIFGTNFPPQDISKWDKDIEVNFILHGSPCQDFSLAGLQAGGDEGTGTRSSLMYETLRIVNKLKPKYVVWENVANLVSEKHFHNFANYINRMGEMGYASSWKVLNSKDFGIPQNRERVFTVSVLGGDTMDLFGYDLAFEWPKSMKLKLCLADMLEDEVDEKYYLSDAMLQYIRANETDMVDKTTKENDLSILKLGHGFMKQSNYDSDIYPTIDTETPMLHTTIVEGNYFKKDDEQEAEDIAEQEMDAIHEMVFPSQNSK